MAAPSWRRMDEAQMAQLPNGSVSRNPTRDRNPDPNPNRTPNPNPYPQPHAYPTPGQVLLMMRHRAEARRGKAVAISHDGGESCKPEPEPEPLLNPSPNPP